MKRPLAARPVLKNSSIGRYPVCCTPWRCRLDERDEEGVPCSGQAIFGRHRGGGVNSPLKKGTGSEPRSEKTRENNGREVPVPLFQQAVRKTIKLRVIHGRSRFL